MITRTETASSRTIDMHVRCSRCHKLLAEMASRPWRIICVRCGHANLGQLRNAPPVELSQPEILTASQGPVTKRRTRKRSRAAVS